MELINELEFNVLKGDKFVVIKVEKPKHLEPGYNFIDGLLVKGYTLISISNIGLGTNIVGFTAYLTKN
tara:strand:- start:180 stop:383 length:204 start_codon:yes stop_codon:yes gene_type:complete